MIQYELMINGECSKVTTSAFIALIHHNNALRKYSSKNRIYLGKVQKKVAIAHLLSPPLIRVECPKDHRGYSHDGIGCLDSEYFRCEDCDRLVPWCQGTDEDARCDDCWVKAQGEVA